MSEGVVVRHHTVELVDVLATVRPEEESTFTTDPELLKNRQLLWHGSGMGNWGSILKTGLRIAPPEAPSTGWLFDKGATRCSCPCWCCRCCCWRSCSCCRWCFCCW